MNVRQLVISIISAIVKIGVLVVLVTYISKWTATAYDFGYRVFTEEPVSSGTGISYTVTFEKGASVRDLAATMQEYGLIRDANLFYVQYLASDYRDHLEPGSYQLSTSMTAAEMMEAMSKDSKKNSETGEAAESEAATETKEAQGTQGE